jgi:hypothetical protein
MTLDRKVAVNYSELRAIKPATHWIIPFLAVSKVASTGDELFY